MKRALFFVAVLGAGLTACDDGSLRAFEPRVLELEGGRGGASGAPGTSGTASGAGAATEVPPTTPLLIDDFEDGDIRAQMPLGWWYPVNDSTVAQGFGVEPTSGETASTYALRTHGTVSQNWGAAVGVDLLSDQAPLSLLGYEELCFMARVEAGSSTAVEVHLLRSTLHYVRDVTVSEAWARYCLPLRSFTSSAHEALVPSELIALQFFFEPKSPFLFWLDDVEVVP